MKLYVKDVVRLPQDTLYSFLYRILKLNGKGFGKAIVKSTYFDPEFKELQCIQNKYRSFDDIVLISKTYFRVSSKAVAKVLKKFLDNDIYLGFVLCDSADKWIFYYGLSRSNDIKYCTTYKGSNKKTNQVGKGIHSFDDIVTLMGLTKEDVKINN